MEWLLNPNDVVDSDLFWFGSKDMWDLFHILKYVTPGATMMDIGANFGYYSCLIARSLEQQCSIYAFEPWPATFDRLTKHLEWNGLRQSVHPVCVGLSDEIGSGQMQFSSSNSGAASFLPGEGGIPVTTLDGFCEERGIAGIDFMKIDVEGLEPKVLKGGRRTLETYHPSMLIEVNPLTLKTQGFCAEDVLGILRDLGYDLFTIHRKQLRPLLQFPEGDDFINVFCTAGEGRAL